jgi:DNA-binding IclR family transcriptional regulator
LFLGGAILERMDIRNEAHDLLKELSEIVNETVHLVVPDGFRAIYIDKLDSNKTIRMYSQIGRIAPCMLQRWAKLFGFFRPRIC